MTFPRLDDRLCRIAVQIGLPGPGESSGDGETERIRQALVENLGDLRNFLVRRGRPTGRWSGIVNSVDEREHGASDGG